MFKTICFFGLATVLFILAGSSCGEQGKDNSAELGRNGISKTRQNGSVSNKTEATPLEPDSEGTAALVDAVETHDMSKRTEAVARIENIAANDSKKRTQITAKLIEEIQKICVDQGRVIESELLFQKVETMSIILSDLQSIEALDVLIDCSNRNRPVVTHQFSEGATVEAIVHYKEKALPALRIKLQQPANDLDDKLLKCSISSTLSAIGGKKAEQILVEAKKNETDGEVLSCMSKSLAGIRVHLKGM